MGNDLKFNIEGLAEVEKMLKDLPLALNQNVVRDVNKAAGKIAREELQDNTPSANNDKPSGAKAENNTIVVNDRKSKTGVLVGFKRKAWYILLQEEGTSDREVKGEGRYSSGNRGKITGNQFITKAHESALPKVIDYLNNNFLKIINKSLRKNANKINKLNRKKK